jgi:hypothetical protein
MKQTTYELLALLDRNLRESITLFKRITACPGQRSDILLPLMNEVQYVRAQVGFEVTGEANDYEHANTTHWSRIHNQYLRWVKDPDDVFLDAEDRDKERKKQGLPPRIIVLPYDREAEEKILAAKKARAAAKRRQSRNRRASSAKVPPERKKP